jgi:hypothetical protein
LFAPIRCLAPLVVAAGCSAALAVAAPSGAASTCKLSIATARHMGPTYVTLLKVSGTSCATAIKVTKAFHRCRLKKGATARCTTKVQGYSCTEKRPASLKSALSFDGDVTCRRGGARVVHHYQQDT